MQLVSVLLSPVAFPAVVLASDPLVCEGSNCTCTFGATLDIFDWNFNYVGYVCDTGVLQAATYDCLSGHCRTLEPGSALGDRTIWNLAVYGWSQNTQQFSLNTINCADDAGG